MKHLFIALLALLVSVAAQAQSPFDKGVKTLGGSISGSYQKSTNDAFELKTREVGLRPAFGLFITKGLLLQLSPVLSYNLSKGEGDTFLGHVAYITKTTSYGLDANVRYYLPQKVFFHIGGGYSMGKVKNEQNGVKSSNTDTATSVAIGIGYAWMLRPSLALEPMVSYTNIAEKLKREGSPNSFTQKTNQLSFNIGLRYFLSKQ